MSAPGPTGSGGGGAHHHHHHHHHQQHQQQQQRPYGYAGRGRGGGDGSRGVGRGRGGYRDSANSLQEVATTLPSFKVTPHAAAQPQQAQHGATVVRSGSTATASVNGGRGTVQFYSSVQRKGGAFTESEAATLRQLGGLKNVQRKRPRDGDVGAFRGEVFVTAAGTLGHHSVADISRRFAAAEEERREKEMTAAKAAVVAQPRKKASRFDVNLSSSSSSSSESDTEE